MGNAVVIIDKYEYDRLLGIENDYNKNTRVLTINKLYETPSGFRVFSFDFKDDEIMIALKDEFEKGLNYIEDKFNKKVKSLELEISELKENIDHKDDVIHEYKAIVDGLNDTKNKKKQWVW